MEIRVVRRTDAELYHWGIKGMKWGQRRYQNKDGSLTPAGEKRYNKELERVKKEKAKLDEKARIEKNKAKTQAKWDKLEEMKRKNQEQRDALSGKTKKGDANDKSKEETLEEKRERLLKTTNAKELYKNKDLLTDAEINERINRIDLEKKLSSRIENEPSKFDKAMERTDRIISAYKKTDEVYSTVANSAIGKALAKKLGIDVEPKKKIFNLDEAVKNLNKMSDKEVKELNERLKADEAIRGVKKARDKEAAKIKKEAEERAAEAKRSKEAEENLRRAQQQVDDYNKNPSQDRVSSSEYSKTGSDIKDSRTYTKPNDKNTPLLETWETVSGTVEGQGTSRRQSESTNSRSRRDDIIDDDSLWEVVDDTPVSNYPATRTSAAESAVRGLLEDKHK